VRSGVVIGDQATVRNRQAEPVLIIAVVSSHIKIFCAISEADMARKYSKKASKYVKRAMRKRKKGTLKSGSGRRVKSKKQAVAIGLSEARKKGAKVPKRKKGRKKRV
jgi:hypothetical protein